MDGLDLSLDSEHLSLEIEGRPALRLAWASVWPAPLDADACRAKFNKRARELRLEVPLR
jgi:hypothetical protein